MATKSLPPGPADPLAFLTTRLAQYIPAKCTITVEQRSEDGDHYTLLGSHHDEAFRANATHVVANSARGVWYALGAWLRLEHSNRTVIPAVHLRGQQISYRALSNTYDAWNVSRVAKYIEELMLFGTNSIEMVAPDGNLSPLFPISPEEMLVEMADAAISRGLNVSLWYPFDAADPEWGKAWANLTHLDVLSIPGGDPVWFWI